MHVVIDIPEVFYEALKKTDEIVSGQHGVKTFESVIYNAVANGTPLPEGHGRIVDIGKIDKDRIDKDNPIIYLTVNGEYIEAVSLDYLNNLSTIVEADKAEMEDK